MHSRTPALTAIDGRGLPIRNVAYLRSVAGDTPSALVTRQQHDVVGRLVAQRDPRLSVANTTTVYALNGEPVLVDSVDRGWRLVLPGLAGEPRQRWDARGHHWSMTFDQQLRRVAVEENGTPDAERFAYGNAEADTQRNLCGQLLEQTDPGGKLCMTSFALTGEPLVQIRTFQDAQTFTSRSVLSPLGVVLEQIDAGGHRQRSGYGLAGQLKQTHLHISDVGDWQAVLLDMQYNAANQIIEQLAGNQVRSRWTYDPTDGRLHTQSSRKSDDAVLQDFEYFYDRVGNITRIEDHAFEPHYFANQLVDGHRDFSYDSLYRLIRATGYDDAPPSEIPGLPQPGDPNNRLNYTQTYQYDHGGNLTELRHVRAGNSYTRQMRIDPQSNRGVRWKPGDGEPDFDTLFDRHGNQQAVHPGKPLSWNARDEVHQVILVARESQINDLEHYAYSQGVRLFKRHEYLAANAEHFHQVRYLPGLEIRTKDNGEELHVISVGSARCLHWVANEPEGIDADQLRYSLEDHLGSCVMELDQNAQLISQEGYYPFGETAWMAARSALEVSYRFVRYSGKEMDVSGLYYYGARYYAPWLQRWVSADPAGDVDGLNLYAFVTNNPILHVDQTGASKVVFDLLKGAVGTFKNAKTATDQLHTLSTEFDDLVPEGADIEELRESMTFGKFITSRAGIKSVIYGIGKGIALGSLIGTSVPGIGNAIGSGVGAAVGAIAFPLLRYHFFKKGLKVAQTLHTQELKDGLDTLGETVTRVADGAQDLVNGGRALIASIQTFTDSLNTYPERLQDMFYEQLNSLAAEKQREILKLARNGIDPFDAIDQVLKAAEQMLEEPSEADGVTGRIQQLQRSITEEPRRKPVPKPRLDLQRRRQAEQSSA